MTKIFDLRLIIDNFVENGGTDLKDLDVVTKQVISELNTTYGIEEDVYKAYTYQYFVEQVMYKISKNIRNRAEIEKDKYLGSKRWETNINTIHRFCCKSKDAEKNMYEKLSNLHYLKLMNIGGGEVCLTKSI